MPTAFRFFTELKLGQNAVFNLYKCSFFLIIG